MNEFPKALTNSDDEQIVVEDADAEAAAAKDGYTFGGKAPAKKAAKPD